MKYKIEEDKRQVARSFFLKSIEDKRAINKCIREGGNLNKVIDDEKLNFPLPYDYSKDELNVYTLKYLFYS